MSWKWSADYKEPGLGFFTRAQIPDKWAHAAGAALIFIVIYAVLRNVLDARYNGKYHYASMLLAAGLVALGGLGFEIYQGLADPWGASFVDMIANLCGIALAAMCLERSRA